MGISEENEIKVMYKITFGASSNVNYQIIHLLL